MKKVIILFVLLLSINLFSQQEKEINKTKFYWGITLGLPNDLNPAICLEKKNFGFRLSGGVWFNKKYGAQLDLFYVFYSNKVFEHQLNLIAGYSHNRAIKSNSFFAYIYGDYNPITSDNLNNSFYIGPAYTISWQGLFFQIAVAIGTGNFQKPKLISQIGYLFLL